MALTQTDLDRLKAAAASNVLEVEEDGVRTRYESIGDLQKRIAYVESEVNKAAAAAAPRRATRYFTPILTRERRA